MIFVRNRTRRLASCPQEYERGREQTKQRGWTGKREGCGEIVYFCCPNIYSPIRPVNLNNINDEIDEIIVSNSFYVKQFFGFILLHFIG